MQTDGRYSCLGFCYEGRSLSPHMLARTKGIKEAYGTTFEGVQFVCVVLKHGVPLDQARTIPYVYGLLSPKQVPIRNADIHLVAYSPATPTDEPILHALKKPSDSKWMWGVPPKTRKLTQSQTAGK